MSIVIHFLNGNDESIRQHYLDKEYRNDIEVEIDGTFFEVYFFTKDALEYEMRKDGFFSLPGIIILDEITTEKVIRSIDFLEQAGYFDRFTGYKQPFSARDRFVHKWYSNTQADFSAENAYSYTLR
jgi:hypothetical protein